MLLAGEDKWRARRYAVASVALALATTLFMVRISYAQSSFQTAMSGKDEGPAFSNCLAHLILKRHMDTGLLCNSKCRPSAWIPPANPV